MDEALEEHVAAVYRFALRLTGDPHRAEDLAQETLVRAWPRVGDLREQGAMRVWLFRIAANVWRDHLRRNHSPVARAETLGESPAGASPSPLRIAAAREDAQRALAALDELPPRQRQVMYLNPLGNILLLTGKLTPSSDKAKLDIHIGMDFAIVVGESQGPGGKTQKQLQRRSFGIVTDLTLPWGHPVVLGVSLTKH